MKNLRFAVAGCGFWSRFQLAAWQEIQGVTLCGLYNKTVSKAENIGKLFGCDAIYDDPEKMLDEVKPDFLDIITNAETHKYFAKLAFDRKIPVISQKPMSDTLEGSMRMTEMAKTSNVPFFVHENWRWQLPIRKLHEKLASGVIGKPFRARITYVNNFPVFENQPFLAELERFIISDIGPHIFDTARFLFGEPVSLYCTKARVNRSVKGEDAATAMLVMENGMTCVIEVSYSSKVEHDNFPETYITVEGDLGVLELGPGRRLACTGKSGTFSEKITLSYYPWVDSRYDLVHTSIVDENKDLLAALRGEKQAETTGEDNLKTVKMVYAAYDSAETGKIINMKNYGGNL